MKHMRKNRQEYAPLESTSRVKPVFSGLLIGGLIGAGTALLFAPQAGEKTRADIQNKTTELRDRTVEGVKDTVSQVKNKTRQVTSDVLGKAQELTQHGKEVLDDQLDEVTQAVNSKRKAVQSY
jgi:gas vesicle protein